MVDPQKNKVALRRQEMLEMVKEKCANLDGHLLQFTAYFAEYLQETDLGRVIRRAMRSGRAITPRMLGEMIMGSRWLGHNREVIVPEEESQDDKNADNSSLDAEKRALSKEPQAGPSKAVRVENPGKDVSTFCKVTLQEQSDKSNNARNTDDENSSVGELEDDVDSNDEGTVASEAKLKFGESDKDDEDDDESVGCYESDGSNSTERAPKKVRTTSTNDYSEVNQYIDFKKGKYVCLGKNCNWKAPFASKHAAQRHVIRTHIQCDKFKCKWKGCSYIGSGKAELAQHVNGRHTFEKNMNVYAE